MISPKVLSKDWIILSELHSRFQV